MATAPILANDDLTKDAEAAAWQEKIQTIFAKWDQYDERIARNQVGINRLGIETRALLADIHAILRLNSRDFQEA